MPKGTKKKPERPTYNHKKRKRQRQQMISNRTLSLIIAASLATAASAQKVKIADGYDVTITGSVQSDILIPQESVQEHTMTKSSPTPTPKYTP